jgi:hypothetical protein
MFAKLLSHSLIEKANKWYLDQQLHVKQKWYLLEEIFLQRFFSQDRFMKARMMISTFTQAQSESPCEAWELYKALPHNYPNH